MTHRTALPASVLTRPGALHALARGAAAGAVGTITMDTLLYLRYRRHGGDSAFRQWEFSDGVQSWEGAPAPALFGKQLIETVTRTKLSGRYASRTNNVTHWTFGAFTGAQYGLLTTLTGKRGVMLGASFGAAVWGSGYVVLQLLKLYEPIWHYDRVTLWRDLSAHLLYGMVAALSYNAMAGVSAHEPLTRVTKVVP